MSTVDANPQGNVIDAVQGARVGGGKGCRKGGAAAAHSHAAATRHSDFAWQTGETATRVDARSPQVKTCKAAAETRPGNDTTGSDSYFADRVVAVENNL